MQTLQQPFSNEEVCVEVKRNEEHKLFDYKAPMAWDESSRDAIELVKDVIAMANSGGGRLVIGVDELDAGGFGFVGITDAQAKSWDPSRVARKVNAYADPPVSLTVRIAECDGAKFAVVSVMGFQRTPHVTKKEFRNQDWGRAIVAPTFYIRTETCESRPVQTGAELNELMERAIRGRHDQVIAAVRSTIAGASTTSSVSDRDAFAGQIRGELSALQDPFPGESYDAYYTDEMFPARFGANRFTRQQLRDALNAAYRPYTAHAFVMYRDDYSQVQTMPDGFMLDLVTSTDPAFTEPNVAYFYWRLLSSGALVVKSLAWEDAYYAPKGVRRIFPNSIIAHVAEAVDALVRLYGALGVADEEITWRFTVSGTNDRELDDPSPFVPPYAKRRPPLQSSVGYEKTLSIEEWTAGMMDHIVEAVRDIFEQMNARVIDDAAIRAKALEHLNRPRR